METNVKCPSCGNIFNVSDYFLSKLKSEFENKYNEQLKSLKSDYDKKFLEIKQVELKTLKLQSEVEQEVQKQLKQRLSKELSVTEKRLRLQIEEEKSHELASYKEQLQLKVDEVKQLNKLKAEFLKVEREKNEMHDKITAELEERFSFLMKEERERMRKESENKQQLKITEKDIIIAQLNEQLKSAQRKAEQGSQQLQGEAYEIVAETFLRENFQTDDVKEIKKGVRGADTLHTVKLSSNTICGSILYESKRTKQFDASWVGKLKKDMQKVNATFGVIITEVLPPDTDRISQINGIWVCTYEEFKGLCFALRETVRLLHDANTSQQNSEGKMGLLYKYLTGAEFRNLIEGLVLEFTTMNDDLNSEMRSVQAMWKRRQKQLESVITGTSTLFGAIKGIAGTAIANIEILELPKQ